MAVELLRQWAASSVFAVTSIYGRRPNGDLQFDGHRPGPSWHAHGYFSVRLWMLDQGRPRRLALWKRRWLEPIAGKTTHSRPPDQLPYVRSCTLIVVLTLWSWLDSEHGVVSHRQVFAELEGLRSRRTAQRWLARALPHALQIQQVIRKAVIERCEPRPVETLFPCGLPPPEGLTRRRWRDPTSVFRLWRGLALLILGSVELRVPVPILLAEARGRLWTA